MEFWSSPLNPVAALWNNTIFLLPTTKPSWVDEYVDLPMPKLGDLPNNEDILDIYSIYYHT